MTEQNKLAVAETILAQLGGRRAIAMAGMHYISGDANSLRFRFQACKTYNHCVITLNAMDLYDVRFCKIRGLKISNHLAAENIYAADLRNHFETITGVYLSLGSFGAERQAAL